jgi:hypothetical protein
MGPMAALNGRGKSRPHRDSIPEPSSPYRLSYPDPIQSDYTVRISYRLKHWLASNRLAASGERSSHLQ